MNIVTHNEKLEQSKILMLKDMLSNTYEEEINEDLILYITYCINEFGIDTIQNSLSGYEEFIFNKNLEHI
jgi:hypothetical protein